MADDAQQRAEDYVRSVLFTHRIPANDEEISRLTTMYLEQQASIEKLYAVEEARYESPALAFNPTPIFADWNEAAPGPTR
jgi:hypothetical protein